LVVIIAISSWDLSSPSDSLTYQDTAEADYTFNVWFGPGKMYNYHKVAIGRPLISAVDCDAAAGAAASIGVGQARLQAQRFVNCFTITSFLSILV